MINKIASVIAFSILCLMHNGAYGYYVYDHTLTIGDIYEPQIEGNSIDIGGGSNTWYYMRNNFLQMQAPGTIRFRVRSQDYVQYQLINVDVNATYNASKTIGECYDGTPPNDQAGYCEDVGTEGGNHGGFDVRTEVEEVVENLPAGIYSFAVRQMGSDNSAFCSPRIDFTVPKHPTETPPANVSCPVSVGDFCGEVFFQGRWDGGWKNGIKSFTYGITEGKSFSSTTGYEQAVSYATSRGMSTGVSSEVKTTLTATGKVLGAKVEGSFSLGVGWGSEASYSTSNTKSTSEGYSETSTQSLTRTVTVTCRDNVPAPQVGQDYYYFQYVFDLVGINALDGTPNGTVLATSRTCSYMKISTKYTSPLCPPKQCVPGTDCQQCKPGTYESEELDKFLSTPVDIRENGGSFSTGNEALDGFIYNTEIFLPVVAGVTLFLALSMTVLYNRKCRSGKSRSLV